MYLIITIVETLLNINSKRQIRKFRKLLKKTNDDSLLTIWLVCRLTNHLVNDENLVNVTDMVQNEIYRIKDPRLLELYIGLVEEFGVNGIFYPWFVLHEFLLYSFDKNKEGHDGIARRIKGGNLRYYLNFSVFPLMSEEMRELITEEDINYVINLMSPLAK